jgi:hypothetical protein
MKPAQIDRIEGEWAVVFVEGEKQPVDIRVSDLPDGAGEGDYLLIEMQGGEVVEAELDPEGKAKAEKRIQDKLGRLRRGDHLKD